MTADEIGKMVDVDPIYISELCSIYILVENLMGKITQATLFVIWPPTIYRGSGSAMAKPWCDCRCLTSSMSKLNAYFLPLGMGKCDKLSKGIDLLVRP